MRVSDFYELCQKFEKFDENDTNSQSSIQGIFSSASAIPHNKENYFGYFLEFVNLLSNCCKNRNKVGKTYVDSIISFEMVLQILQDPLNSKLKLFRAFMRLALNAYIDQPPYSPINYFNNIQIWEELDNNSNSKSSNNSLDNIIVKTSHPISENINIIIKYTEDKIVWLESQIKDATFDVMPLLYERISIFLLTYK